MTNTKQITVRDRGKGKGHEQNKKRGIREIAGDGDQIFSCLFDLSAPIRHGYSVRRLDKSAVKSGLYKSFPCQCCELP